MIKKKNSVSLITAIVLAFALVSCTPRVTKVMESWVGSHKSDLFLSWGPPTRVAPDGRGGEILIYEFYRDLGQKPGKMYVDAYGNVRYTDPKQRGYTATRMFYVTKDGIIYSWRWKGY
jgi:hypothetical protein